MGVQMSTSEVSSEGSSEGSSEVSSDDDEPDDGRSNDRRSDSSEVTEDNEDEDNDNLTYHQRRIIKQPSLNRVVRMSSMESGTSPPYQSLSSRKQNQPPPLRKQQHESPQSQRVSTPLNSDSATADVEAEKMKKLLEWELSTLEADDLRSHAWYHGQQVDRTEAERLLRQCVAEEHGSVTANIIAANDTITPSNNVTATATKGSSLLQHHVEENTSDSDGMDDVSSESSDADFTIDDCMDEPGMVPDPSLATSTKMAVELRLQQCRGIDGVLKRPKRPHRPRRHFYCFLVRDSLNVRPPGRYVVSCLRVDKYEDLETDDKNTSQRCHDDEQRRKFQRKQQRRQRRQHQHPVLHFVVNEIILQPGTVYERSQFSFGETLPSMTSAISIAVSNNNVGIINDQRQCQPGFDSVPDLIRYYVGGADDNAVLSYGGINDGVVSGSMSLSRTAQTEVRIRYPCNRRRPLMNENSLAEVASPNILPSTMENSRLMRQRCRNLNTASTRTEGLRVLSTSPGWETEASTSSQNKNHRRHSPSPPPQTSKWMRVQTSSRSSVRRTPSATVTSAMVTSTTSLNPSSAAESVNQNQSQPLTLSPCSSRIDPQSSITGSSSGSPDPSATTLPRPSRSPRDLLKTFPSRFKPEIASTSMGSSTKTLPHQPKSSYPLPSNSESSSSLSYERPSTSGSKSNSDQSISSLQRTPSYPGSRSNPHSTNSDLLSSPSSSTDSSGLSGSESGTNYLNRHFSKPRPSISSTTTMGTNVGAPRPAINVDSPEIPSSVRDTFDENAVDLFSLPFETAIMSSFFQMNVRRGIQSMLYRMMRHQYSNRLRRSGRSRRSGSNHHRSDGPESRSARRRNRPERRRVSINSQSISSSSDNENDDEDLEEQQSSSSDLSFISTSTLEDEELKRNRDGNGQLVDPQKVKSAIEQSQQNDRQFTGRQVVNCQRESQDEAVQEVENPMQNVKVRRKNVEEEHTRLDDWVDTKVDQKQSDEQKPLDIDSNAESSSEASENQNFQKCRTRWTNTLRQGLVDMLEQPHLDHQNRQLTQVTETQDCDPRQRSSRQMHQTLNEDQEVDDTTGSMETELRRSIPDTETRQLARSTNRTDQAATVAPTQTSNRLISVLPVNDDVYEDMIMRYFNLPTIYNQSRNTEVAEMRNGRHLPELIGQRMRQINRRMTASENHQMPTGGNLPSAGEYLREHVIPSGETQLRDNQEGEGPSVTKGGRSITTAVESSTDTSGQEISTCSVGVGSFGCRLAFDYVNINPPIDDCNNSSNKSDTEHLNTNNLDRIHHKNYNHQSSKIQSNIHNSFVHKNIEAGADYENIISHNTNDTDDCNYENIGQTSNEKRQKLMNDFNRGSTAVASALRAVHLAIIGDPDDTSGASVGTGRLAAALCRADGRVTVLPYRRNITENKQVGPLLSTCPLQLLSQPGPAGRRARLDVIERFACLQYLVAMTVIVTPCLLLIGSDISDKESHEWSLEDEYEYRRRRFYYRCAGISSWCVSDNNSTSDDDDESYKLTANSDFDSGYSLPPKEEWAVEKRHWLDLLTRHRAAALDKWIRTAADAKQAVGDVYGYRALMSALCSDRIQALQDAWATLRRLHTATAVSFESRLRPEFLGRREKNVVAVLGKPGINDIDDNDVNDLLQLPPNATVPDATALAVLYEHLYNDNNTDTNNSINTISAISNDIGSKKEKDPRLSSFFTSPLLLSPSPWSSLNSGISGGLGLSIASDYGLSALHVQCIQYSEWVQQSLGNDDSILPLTKSPMLQLDRFRSNFRALLRQYSGSEFDNYDEGDESFNCVLSYKDKHFQKDENTSYHEEFNCNQNDNFAYERQYEYNVEEYGTSGADYDECGDDDDDDDDDATVICCNNISSLSAVKSVAVDTMCGDSHVADTATEKQRQTTTKNEQCHRLKQNQEEDRYYRWIEDVSANGPGPAPLNIVFCTELHVRLFWPPTLFLQDINDTKDTVDSKLPIPAYALGTTYTAIAIAAYDNESESTDRAPPTLSLNHVITAQLDQAAQDMRLRYKAMDDFLDRACAYSTLVAKMVYRDNTMVGKQQQHCILSQCI